MVASVEIVTFDDLPRREAGDVAVVIDTIRAFTTAAVAFERGAASVMCVAGLHEALELRSSGSASLAMGEERGQRPDGYDFGNSPVELMTAQPSDLLAAATLAQRTTNGTRGLVATAAPHVIAAGATTAAAVIRHLSERHSGARIDILTTGTSTSEDAHTARYIEAGLIGAGADARALRSAVLASRDDHVAGWRSPATEHRVQAFLADIEVCADVGRHDFVMVGSRPDPNSPLVELTTVPA